MSQPDSQSQPKPLVIAIDGPSGSGKSSVSRAAAAQMGYRYLDTGAMYRAATWWMVDAGIDPADTDAVASRIEEVSIENGTDPAGPTISVGGVDVAGPIRTDEITSAVSAVSAVPAVRTGMLDRQREEVDVALAAGVGIIVEGRDIGTVVLPDADLKVFLTADQQARAARRTAQDTDEGRTSKDESETAAALAARDEADSTRQASPLAQADDAVLVDATFMTFDEVVAAVLELIADKQKARL